MKPRYQDSCSLENPTHFSRKTKQLLARSAKFKLIQPFCKFLSQLKY